MLAVGLALGSLLFMGILFVTAVAWALREHHIANLYRNLAKELQKHQADNPIIAPAGGFVVTYKHKGKQHTARMNQETESLALAAFTKSVPYSQIVSIEKA